MINIFSKLKPLEKYTDEELTKEYFECKKRLELIKEERNRRVK